MADLWNDRLMWSGEVPLDYPELNPVALGRIRFDTTRMYYDEVNTTRRWQFFNGAGVDGYSPGPWGSRHLLNQVNPSTDQGRLSLNHFPGLWPTSGKLLLGLWLDNRAVMSFSPLISSRGGSQPLAYLSTDSEGRPRSTVYNTAGTAVLDFYDLVPWSLPGIGEWEQFSMLVDFDAQTCQLGAVNRQTGQTYVGPVRNFTGAARVGSNANVDVFSLQQFNYWTTGAFDEIVIAHPGENFDLATYVNRVAQSRYANAQAPGNPVSRLDVSDTGVVALQSQNFFTGAEQVAWTRRPVFPGMPSGATPLCSTDNGATWQSSTQAALPEPFSGLLRWEIPLAAQETFSGADLVEPTAPPPTLAPIGDVTLEQNAAATRSLSFTITGPQTWSVQHSGIADIQRVGSTLTINSGWPVGTDIVTVTLTDEYQQSVSRTFTVEVTPASAPPPDQPIYPRAPIILWNEDEPDAVLAEPLSGIITQVSDGEDTFTFSMFADDPLVHLIKHEERVTCAGETYRIRRVTDEHRGGSLLKTVYCEARFYDLATAGQIDAREFTQVSAGQAMEIALAGTGWTVGIANVSTLRSYEIEDTNPLEFLRFIRSRHGGELIFDNENQTVSLLTSYGKDNGVTFFYGHGLSDTKRVIDTTSLVTRIYARNAEGLTIASVNGGVPYVEDYSFTDELKVAVYDFASGTSPFTMLQMATATLGNRSQPDTSYEVTVDDLSFESGNEIDRFALRDFVRVVDEELGINTLQRVVGIEYDVIRPWNSQLTLGARLREIRSDTDVTDAGVLTTGLASTFDLVPYNLLLNGRFDNDLNHWARFGVVVEKTDQGTSAYSAVFRGSGERWIEQTVQADNRSAYALSLDVEARGGPSGWVPSLVASAVVTYEDGTSETIQIGLT